MPVAPLPSSFWMSYFPTCRLRSRVKSDASLAAVVLTVWFLSKLRLRVPYAESRNVPQLG